MRLRRLVFGLSTLLGMRRRGYFIPYRHAEVAIPPGDNRHYDAVETLFARQAPVFADRLERIEVHAASLKAIGDAPPPAPRWNQDWFARLDAAAAYSIVRDLAPRKIVEIGSGHSTRFMARAIADGGLAAEFVAIDPEPRAAISGLPIQFHRTTLGQAPAAAFRDLAAGDVLFVDSSHILMPGSDVDTLLNRVLPALAPGTIVHFHDVFLPEDYPQEWQWRGYNEQLGIAALLLGGGYDVLFASRFVATKMAGRIGRGVLGELPLLPGAFESSLWLRKKTAAIEPI